MLSSRIRSAPASSASRTCGERLGLDLDRQAVSAADAPDGSRDAAGEAQVVVLDQDRVVEPDAVVRAAAAADGVLLERAQAGRRLARVEDRRAGALDRVDVAARQRRDAAEAAEQVERSALAGEHGARRPSTARAAPGRRAGAVGDERLERETPGRARGRRRARHRARRRRRAPRAGAPPCSCASAPERRGRS